MNYKKIIEAFANSPDIINMGVLVDSFKSENVSDEAIAFLATKLAKSGDIIRAKTTALKADIPSTGGPSSLSTLICPLILKDLGFCVPKLGIPGRPAGGIDVLYQIAGYKIHFQSKEIYDCLDKYNYCHFIGGKNITPLDSVLFKYRSDTGSKAVPALVISSILAKKMATELSITGLDVRIGDFGNFGQNWESAKKNSQRFVRVAKKVNIDAKCFLNNVNSFLQPYIGRGESLVALKKIFEGEENLLLSDHLFKCIGMACQLGNEETPYSLFKGKYLMNLFKDNIDAQGGSMNAFYDVVNETEKKHIFEVVSPGNGFLKVDLGKLREAIVLAQGSQRKFPDDCGVIFIKMPLEYVNKGDVILTYRTTNRVEETHNKILASILIVNSNEKEFEYEIIY